MPFGRYFAVPFKKDVILHVLNLHRMLRLVVIAAFAVVFVGAEAFYLPGPLHDYHPIPVNHAQGNRLHAGSEYLPAAGYPFDARTPADTSLSPQVLMLNYSAYDSAYANKVRRIIQGRLPRAVCSDFWDGTDAELQQALTGKQVVVVAYPYGGQAPRIRAFGKILEQFTRQGGIVVFTGTHYYNVLQQFGLLDLQKGYFCKEPHIKGSGESHLLLDGTPKEFSLHNYAYPLDIRDPGFISLADVKGYPVLGYKPLGEGQVLYIGLEYYYDEGYSSRILANAVLCGAPEFAAFAAAPDPQPVVSEWNSAVRETLYAGAGTPSADLKIYPNPYADKGFLEIDLKAPTRLYINMTDVNGGQAAVLLPQRALQQGFYRFELPDVKPGIYFVQCYFDEQLREVRKVVKVDAP